MGIVSPNQSPKTAVIIHPLSLIPYIVLYSANCLFDVDRTFFPANKTSGIKALRAATQFARTVTFSCPSLHVIFRLSFPNRATTLHLLGLVGKPDFVFQICFVLSPF